MASDGGRPFYGWAVVAAVFAMLAVASGLGFYNLTVYLRALVDEQGFSVGAASGATAVFFLTSGVVGLGVAALLARVDVRLVIAAGAAAAGVALFFLGRVGELWQLYLVYALFGAGFAASGLVPGTTLIARWFSRRRSVALSVASTGLSVGGVLLTPLCASLIDDRGLAEVTPYLAVAYVLGIVPVATLVLRPSPAALGLAPDGDPVDVGSAARPPDGTPLADAVRSRFFLVVTASFVLAMLAQVGGLAHLYNLAAERLDEDTGARAVQVVAVTSIVGRLAGGWLVTVVPMRMVTLALIVLQAVAMLALAAASDTGSLLVAAVLFGITVGNLLMLQPLLLASAFGVLDYARIYARSQLLVTMGTAAGPAIVGTLHDTAGTYGPALVVAATASLLSFAVLIVSGPIVPSARRPRLAPA